MVPEKVKYWKKDHKMIMGLRKVKFRKNRDRKMTFDPRQEKICDSKTIYGFIKNILTRLNLSKLLLD